MKSDEFITADLHLGHRAVIRYSGRPFADADEMDEALVEKWNAKVARTATTYIVGDVSFHRPDRTRELLARLNGTIRLITGNHDRKGTRRVLEERCEWVKPYYESKTEDGVKVCMFHYPMLTWNGSHHGSWHVHGHCHASLAAPATGRRIDVGVDARKLFGWPDYEPWSFAELARAMAMKTFEQVDHHRER